MKRGRPPAGYTTEVMKEVIRRVASGDTLRAVCSEEGMPREETFRKWVSTNPELQKMWLQAKEFRSHSMFDRCLDIAAKLEKDYKTLTAPEVAALKTAIETYKHGAARLNPRDYGERVPANPVVPIQIVTTLNLGQEGPAQKLGGEEIWHLKAPTKIIDVKPVEKD